MGNGMLKMEKILHLALENTPNGLAVVDGQGTVIFVNRQYCEFAKTSQEKLLGTNLSASVSFSLMTHILKSGERIIKLVQDTGEEKAVLEEKPILQEGRIEGGISYLISQKNRSVKMLLDQLNTLAEEVRYYRERLASKETGSSHFRYFISSNEKLMETVELARRAAMFDANILITGETGTGKELLATAIHHESKRKKHPFIKVNCAAIPTNLLESELFGYEGGAFTGARGDGKPGKFELANHGTIFLDEIGDMPLEMQAKILRVIQEREIERVGGTKTVKVDVRIISATNRDLAQMVAEGTFREDLYYRLLVIGLRLPPLRERLEDLPYIANDILNRLCMRYEVSKPEISPQGMTVLKKYQWPGNIRELENVLERALNLTTGGVIEVHHFPEKLLANAGVRVRVEVQNKTLDQLIELKEKEIIYETLAYTGNNKQKAAEILGLSRTALYKKLKKYNIS